MENRNWSILIGQSVSCQVSDWLTFLHMNLRYLKNPPQIYLVSDWLSVLNDLFIHGRWIARARNTNTSFHWRSNGIRYFNWLLKRFFKTKTFILGAWRHLTNQNRPISIFFMENLIDPDFPCGKSKLIDFDWSRYVLSVSCQVSDWLTF